MDVKDAHFCMPQHLYTCRSEVKRQHSHQPTVDHYKKTDSFEIFQPNLASKCISFTYMFIYVYIHIYIIFPSWGRPVLTVQRLMDGVQITVIQQKKLVFLREHGCQCKALQSQLEHLCILQTLLGGKWWYKRVSPHLESPPESSWILFILLQPSHVM